MATHSSILAWRIPWTEESGGLQSMGLQRVEHDWSDSMHACTHAPEPKHLTIIEIFGITALRPVWSLANWCYEHSGSLGWRYQKQEMRPFDLDLLGVPIWSPVLDRSLFPQLTFIWYRTFSTSCPPPHRLTWWSTSSWAMTSSIFPFPACQSAEMEPLSWGTVCCDCPVSLNSSPWPVRACYM